MCLPGVERGVAQEGREVAASGGLFFFSKKKSTQDKYLPAGPPRLVASLAESCGVGTSIGEVRAGSG